MYLIIHIFVTVPILKGFQPSMPMGVEWLYYQEPIVCTAVIRLENGLASGCFLGSIHNKSVHHS